MFACVTNKTKVISVFVQKSVQTKRLLWRKEVLSFPPGLEKNKKVLQFSSVRDKAAHVERSWRSLTQSIFSRTHNSPVNVLFENYSLRLPGLLQRRYLPNWWHQTKVLFIESQSRFTKSLFNVAKFKHHAVVIFFWTEEILNKKYFLGRVMTTKVVYSQFLAKIGKMKCTYIFSE